MEYGAVEQLVQALAPDPINTNNTYSAIVSQIDNDGTVWVNVAGGTIDTPTASKSSEVEVGDSVTVEWRANKLYIAGNASNPSAGSARVDVIESTTEQARTAAQLAQQDAQTAHQAAEEAVATAESVQGIAQQAQADAQSASTAATQAQNSLKSVVQGATTVEKAVSVMQTALEAIVDYDPTEDEVQEYFWHDANGAHILGDESGYRNDLNSTGMSIVDTTTEESVAEFGADGIQLGNERTIIISAQGESVADKAIWVKVLDETMSLPAQIDLSIYDAFKNMDGSKDRINFEGSYTGLSGTGINFYKGTARTVRDTWAQMLVEYDGEHTITVNSLSSSYNAASIVIRFRIQKKGGIFSFGQRFGDAGAFSSIFGESLIASGDDQLVIGKYNEEDSQKAFIIGNGSSNTTGTNIIRSNAFTIAWNGNVDIADGAKYKINGTDLAPSDLGEADYVVEQGTSGGWYYRKWDSGRLDADRVWNVGQVTLGTAEGTTHRVSADITIPTPSMMIGGTVEASYVGNSSNSPSFIEKTTNNKLRIAKVITSNVTLQNVTIALRLVGGTWK